MDLIDAHASHLPLAGAQLLKLVGADEAAGWQPVSIDAHRADSLNEIPATVPATTDTPVRSSREP